MESIGTEAMLIQEISVHGRERENLVKSDDTPFNTLMTN